MPLRYVSTCAGGGHHLFRDNQDSSIERVMTVAELDERRSAAQAAKDENDDFEQSLPAFLKNRGQGSGNGAK